MKQKNSSKLNVVEKATHIIKEQISSDNILSTLANLWSDTKTKNNLTYSVLQGILSLYSYTLKDALFNLGGNISELPKIKKRTVTVEIRRRWGQGITEEVEIIVVYAKYKEGGVDPLSEGQVEGGSRVFISPHSDSSSF